MSILSEFINDIGQSPQWLIATRISVALLLAMGLIAYRRTYKNARHAAMQNAELIDNLFEGVYRCKPGGEPISANRALIRLLGFQSEAEALAHPWDPEAGWYVDPQRRIEFRKRLWSDGQLENFVSEISRAGTGERIWISESARLVRNAKNGKVEGYEGSVYEITDSVRRRELENRFRKLTDLLPGGLFQLVLHSDGRISLPYISGGFCRTIGIAETDQIADPAGHFTNIDEEDRKSCLKSLLHSSRTLGEWQCEVRVNLESGPQRWLHIIAQPEAGDDGSTTWHGYLSDITERKQQELQIAELAYYDPLTKLPNRRVMIERMAETIAECRRLGRHSALLYIDLDRFKSLNDTHGHEAGDQLLVEVAARLSRSVRAEDTVARIGGDEFVVLLKSMCSDGETARQSAVAVAEKLLAELRRPFVIGHMRYSTSASIGAVTFDGDHENIDDVLRRADLAMYEVKTGYRNGIAIGRPGGIAGIRHIDPAPDLSGAISRREFQLFLQPQVDRKGTLVGAEGLLRWAHPKAGLLLPDQFLPLADQCGLTGELDLVAIDMAADRLCEWSRLDMARNLRIAVNVRTTTLESPDLAGRIGAIIGSRGIDAHKLTLEITEQARQSDQERLKETMTRLRARGVRFALDDFGSGYGSITYLKQMPFDEVKIDGKVVTEINGADGDRALVKTILAMAGTLGITAVAEHVENERQEHFLRAYGCDVFQGYLYSGALSGPNFIEYAGTHGGRIDDTHMLPRMAMN